MKYVEEFENKIAEFFGSPYAVAVDSCTHGLELCLRYLQRDYVTIPKHTYLSVPMLADKLDIEFQWDDSCWFDYYFIDPSIADAAVMWGKNSYIKETFMCLSFQYQKHLSLGRGGMILTDNKEAAIQLKKMSYDGRMPDIPWREQNVDTMGYHYYMTPETAELGLKKLPEAIKKEPRSWSFMDYPDLTKMKIFQ